MGKIILQGRNLENGRLAPGMSELAPSSRMQAIGPETPRTVWRVDSTASRRHLGKGQSLTFHYHSVLPVCAHSGLRVAVEREREREKLRHLLQIKHALSLSLNVDLYLFSCCVRASREARHELCAPCKHSRKV